MLDFAWEKFKWNQSSILLQINKRIVNREMADILWVAFVWDCTSETHVFEILETICQGDIQQFCNKEYDQVTD